MKMGDSGKADGEGDPSLGAELPHAVGTGGEGGHGNKVRLGQRAEGKIRGGRGRAQVSRPLKTYTSMGSVGFLMKRG